jgi:hypothetical protein
VYPSPHRASAPFWFPPHFTPEVSPRYQAALKTWFTARNFIADRKAELIDHIPINKFKLILYNVYQGLVIDRLVLNNLFVDIEN